MCDEDTQLQQIINNFCQSPPGSFSRKRAEIHLLARLGKLRGLARPHNSKYNESYAALLNETWLEVIKRVCVEYQPTKSSLTTWINSQLRLYYKIQDLYRNESRNPPPLSLDQTLSDDGETKWLDTLESKVEQWQEKEEIKLIGAKIWEYLENDPDGRLEGSHPQNHPACNCHHLVLRLLLKEPKDTLASIVREHNIDYQTLNSHYKRSCFKLFREIAIQLGYSPE